MRHIVLTLAGTFLLATAACSQSDAQSGPSISRAFPVGSFTAIEVAGPYDVTVVTGKAASVNAQGPQKLIEAMEVSLDGDKLRIRPRRQGMFSGMNWSGGNATVAVSVPALRAAALAGSGDLTVDRVNGEQFTGAVAGSGDLRLGNVAVKSLKLAVAGSGTATVAGQTNEASYAVAGSGDLDAVGLTAASARIDVAGSGNVRARVTGEAKASVAGSGDVEISGGARCQTSKHGSGDVRCS